MTDGRFEREKKDLFLNMVFFFFQHGKRRDIALVYPVDCVNILIRFCCGVSNFADLQLTLDNVCDVLQLANECEIPKLHKMCEHFLCEHIQEIENLGELEELAKLISPSLVGMINSSKKSWF